jgi:hypothetical protein
MISSLLLLAAAKVLDARPLEAAMNAFADCAVKAAIPLLPSQLTNEGIVQAAFRVCKAEAKRYDDESRKLTLLATPPEKRGCCLKKMTDDAIAANRSGIHDALLARVKTSRR